MKLRGESLEMKKSILSLVLLMGVLISPAQAHEEIERENLSLFVKEIDFLISEVERINKLSRTDSRMVFDYKSLRNDLMSMKQGIRSYINKDINDGRVIPPLKGDY